MNLSMYSAVTLNQQSAEIHYTEEGDIRNGISPLVQVTSSSNPPSSNTPAAPANDTRPRQGGITITFPMKLHAMLLEIDESISDVISWNDEGDAFVIQKPKNFTAVLLPKYFRTKKFTSFQRQLNAYGFVRGNLYAGQEDMHIYHHEVFHRDHQDRLHSIKRRGSLGLKTSGKKNRHRAIFRVDTSFPMGAKAIITPDTVISVTTPTTMAAFDFIDFDGMMADLARDGLEEEEVPAQQQQQYQQQVVPQQCHHQDVVQQQQLLQQLLQQDQLQQQFSLVSYNNSNMRDSVLDEAVAAVVSIDDARSLYGGMLNNWNTDEEGLWSDSNS